MQRKIKIRYIVKHKATNNLISFEVTLKDIEKYEGFWWMASMITGIPEDAKFKYELVATLQYTGLVDKNGKEIYEGDVLQDTLWGANGIADVSFIEGAFVCTYKDKRGRYNITDRIPYGIEVIGNIYETSKTLTNE